MSLAMALQSQSINNAYVLDVGANLGVTGLYLAKLLLDSFDIRDDTIPDVCNLISFHQAK